MNNSDSDQISGKPYSRLRYVGAVLWASFLTACVGSMVFFAMFDPAELAKITTWPVVLEIQWGYTIGFFCFWLLAVLSSLITTILLLPGNKSSKAGNE